MVNYADAGVDIHAGDRAVELMKDAVASTHNSTVIGAAGGFAGMVDASALRGMKRPLLATSTDGVGTKIALARALDIHDTIGFDLVGMVVDDIAVCGARPLFMTDYIACGRVDPERIAAIVRGIACAAAEVDCPLVGGETAEHPGVMAVDDYDIAGAATGVVEADRLLGSQRVKVGDRLVALAASGVHSNGFSLVRRIVADCGWSLEDTIADFGRTLGEELLEPTRLYSRVLLDLVETVPDGSVHALSHITGGGLGANLSRVMPRGLVSVVDRGSWRVPPVFTVLREGGNVTWEAAEETWNLGVGMVAVVDESVADRVVEFSYRRGIDAWVLGEVVADSGGSVAAEAIRGAGGNLPAGRLIRGAKGVDAGAALLCGRYRDH